MTSGVCGCFAARTMRCLLKGNIGFSGRTAGSGLNGKFSGAVRSVTASTGGNNITFNF